MNRVNKYRGQRCNDGQWVYGYYVESNRSWAGHKPHKSWIVTSVMSNGGFFNVVGRYAVKDDTVGQFIGLTDKNGREIYEGDIFTVNGKYPKLVKYLDAHACFCVANLYDLNAFPRWPEHCVYQQISFNWWKEFANEIEVIGNIYDNPELIKE